MRPWSMQHQEPQEDIRPAKRAPAGEHSGDDADPSGDDAAPVKYAQNKPPESRRARGWRWRGNEQMRDAEKQPSKSRKDKGPRRSGVDRFDL